MKGGGGHRELAAGSWASYCALVSQNRGYKVSHHSVPTHKHTLSLQGLCAAQLWPPHAQAPSAYVLVR